MNGCECTGTRSEEYMRPELYLLVLYTDQWEDFSLCSVPTNEMTSLAVYWPMSALVDWFPDQIKPHMSGGIVNHVISKSALSSAAGLQQNWWNTTLSFCLKPVSTCCIKPKPLKICSYLNINKIKPKWRFSIKWWHLFFSPFLYFILKNKESITLVQLYWL